MRHQRVMVIVVSAVTLTAILFVDAAVAKTSKISKAFVISGQVSGRLSEANHLDLCESGTIRVGKVYQSTLTLPAVKPLKGDWSIEIDARLGTTKFPAKYPTSVTLTSPTGPSEGPAWMAGGTPTPTGSGTLKLTKTGGSLNLVLPLPESMEATKAEEVVGSWSCP